MKHILRVLALYLCLVLFPEIAPAQEAAPTVQFTSMTIVKQNAYMRDAELEYQRFGTTVTATLAVPGATIISLDQKASNVEVFQDDLGNDLTRSTANIYNANDPYFGSWHNAPISGSPDYSNSVHPTAWALAFYASGAPGSGATWIHIKAHLAVICGSGPTYFSASNVNLQPGAVVQIGPVQLTLKSISHDDLLKRWTYRFVATGNVTALSWLNFEFPAGFAANPKATASWPYTNQGGEYLAYYYDLWSPNTKPASVNVLASYFAQVRTVPINIDQNVGLGL